MLTARYFSPLGEVLLAGEGETLTGLWFQGQRYFAATLETGAKEGEIPVFHMARQWLDAYFAGERPAAFPDMKPVGSPFQQKVWQALLKIPYGETMTYGQLAAAMGYGPGYSRAVGGAVSHNPISILIPCHRVVGSGGRLTGYAGGLKRKIALLKLEDAMKKDILK